MRILLISISIAVLSACASSEDDKYLPIVDYDQASEARGQAYSADTMRVRKKMKRRPAEFKPMDFFYKECTELGEGSYYSKTNYNCSSPF